jgi:hypothetical protein
VDARVDDLERDLDFGECQMAIVCMAVIKPEDFEIFKRLLGPSMPDSYDGWHDLTVAFADRIVREGDRPQHIEVNPDEFAAWLMAQGTQGTADSLNDFVACKAPWEYDE